MFEREKMTTHQVVVHPGDIVNEDDFLSNIDNPLYNSWLQSIDVILLLGGGVPLSPTEPPLYVQRRCDVVAQIMTRMHQRVLDGRELREWWPERDWKMGDSDAEVVHPGDIRH